MTTDSILIRKASSDQAKTILDILITAFEQYRDSLDPPTGVFQETADNIREKLESGGGFVAFDGTQVVGVVLYQPREDYMYLGRLAVLPNHRGRHIAPKLIAAVEETAIEQNLYRVQLGVRLVLTDNQTLFQRCGYQVIAYRAHEGYSEDTYAVMEKALTLESKSGSA